MPAATIGPMVCDELGPIPTLNMSNTDKNIFDPKYLTCRVDHVWLKYAGENATHLVNYAPVVRKAF